MKKYIVPSTIKQTLLTIALLGFAGVASAQLGGSDLGQTAPTPGPNDAAQVTVTSGTAQVPDGTVNYFWDNGAPVGSSFVTGANVGGYTMTSLAIKYGDDGGWAGGNDINNTGGWVISVYQLSGATYTTATQIYHNTVGAIGGQANTGADWLQFTGFNLALAANSHYAWTIQNPDGSDNLAWATNASYAGDICTIPAGGGTVTYTTQTADSAAFDVGLSTTAGLGGTDLGATAPTPGGADAAQVTVTSGSAQLPDGTVNYFWDNGVPVGSSFTTGADPSGYEMTSLAVKYGDDSGWAGGVDVGNTGGWVIGIYQLSGATYTTATQIYQGVVGPIGGAANSGHDWLQFTGFDLALAQNSHYAWTINVSGSGDNLAWATGASFAGDICTIPAGGGTVTYTALTSDSAAFDVGLTANQVPLTATDLGQTAPTPGASDAAQVLTTGDNVALPDSGGLNNFYDNTSPGSHSGAVGYVGSSFATGPNPGGYSVGSLSIKFGGTSPYINNGYAGGNDTGGPSWGGWDIQIYQLSGAGFTNATLVYHNTVELVTGTTTGASWIEFTGFFLPQPLLPNSEYAWTIFQPNGYDDLGYATPSNYVGGAICEIPSVGGTVTYYPSDADSAAFDVGLTPAGFPSVGTPTASINPVYALSPITISDTASGPGTLTYQWQTNSDLSGGLGGTWVNIPNATNLTQAFTPLNSDVGTLDFQFVASNSAGATVSGPLALTVYASQPPASSTGVTPSSFLTYAGATVSFTDSSFVGTTPITYQWYFNNELISSALNPSATNTTLTVTNVQSSGTYALWAHNSQGTTSDASVQVGTLTLLTPPPLPTSTSPQNVPYVELADGPWAYWRLQETANPQTATVVAYDYSGNGFFATYGDEMSDDATGPTPPVYPGFSAGEVSAQPYSALPNGYLTVPPLNLTSNNISFVAWINPAGPQNNSTGLLFNRNGGDAAGFGFNANPNGAGMPCLGFTWNSNGSATWSWKSGLYPVAGDWSLVAYVITPTNETTYLYYVDTTVSPYTTNYYQSSIKLANIVETFSTNTIYLGADTQQTSSRTFYGSMAEMALYQRALSQNDVQTIFLTAINSTTAPATAPTVLPTVSLFAGESYTFNGTAGGTAPIYYQWKSSTDGNTFTNVPANQNYSDPTQATLTINNAASNNILYYEVVAHNSIATSTSGPGQITEVAPVPTGLWTVNFQLTNDTLAFSTSTSGGGQYAGPGVLGSGTYWNAFVDTSGAFASGTFSTATDLESDGSTHSGIYATVTGDNDSTLTVPAAPSSISTLLDQFAYGTTSLTFTGVPDGTYNLIIYGIDGGFTDGGTSFTVNAANGTQTGSLQNTTDTYFAPGDNSAVFTGVQVAGGTLIVNVSSGSSGIYNGNFNGAQLQLVSYNTGTVDHISLSPAVSANGLILTWSGGGDLQTATNVAGPWVSLGVESPYTNTMTNPQQYFRVMIPNP
jgi:hypothetical protein